MYTVRDFPIGSQKPIGPTVVPNKCRIRCRRGSLLACNEHTIDIPVYNMWHLELHLWFDCLFWMLTLCRLDSFSFLVIFFCSFIVFTESTFWLLNIPLDTLFYWVVLYRLVCTNSSWQNMHICIYIFTSVSNRIQSCHLLKSLVVKLYYNLA